MRLTLSLPLLLPLALLAACGGSGTSADDERSATGEVLEGTISDEMLPLATVTSQPPLLPPEEQGDDARTSRSGEQPSGAATPTPSADGAEAEPAAPPVEASETSE